MKKYTEEEIGRALAGVGVAPGDAILVHGSLFALGRLARAPVREIPDRVLAAILEHLGPRGTLVVPAFDFDFCRGRGFDRSSTKTEGMGNLSERVLADRRAERTPHPMQSIAAIGPLASRLVERDTPSSFDERGPFRVLLDAGAKLVLFGAPMQAASLVHYAEERVGVPYRYWKEFRGPCTDAGHTEERAYSMYVRDLERDPQLKLEPIAERLAERGRYARRALGGGEVAACTFADFIETTIEGLRADPYWLVDTIKETP